MRGERGFALVIALVVTALLVALLVEFVNEVYVDTSHSHNFVAAQQAGILAESGIQGGIGLVKGTRGPSYSSLLESWARPQVIDSGSGSVTITIEEETGKLNLNTATTPNGTDNEYTGIAEKLFDKLRVPVKLVQVLRDWVDENEDPNGGDGAETNIYKMSKPPYSSKNQKLETFEELALLKGFTPDVLVKLKPCVTVYGLDPDINVNTADKEVLAALGMGDDLVERILDYRKRRTIKDAAEFGSIAGVNDVQGLYSKITYGGTIYRIRSEGKVGETVSVAEAVVTDIQNPKPTVLYWRQY